MAFSRIEVVTASTVLFACINCLDNVTSLTPPPQWIYLKVALHPTYHVPPFCLYCRWTREIVLSSRAIQDHVPKAIEL